MSQRDDKSKLAVFYEALLENAKPIRREPYLEPEDSPFSPARRLEISSYELRVAQALVEPIEHHLGAERYREAATLVCIPSFTPEWALWVAGERKTGFSVILTEAEENLWYLRLRAEMPLTPGAVRMHHGQLAMNRADAICDIWRNTLSQTKYHNEPLLGNDGVTYHFAYWVAGKTPLSGKTWSPEEATPPGKLAALGRSIKDYVRDQENQDVFLKVIDDHLAWFQFQSN